jgi:squalene synthase HpnC
VTEESFVAREREEVGMVTAVQSRPPDLPSDAEILGRAGTENFTVASRLLPARYRRHLLAFYGYARLIDHLGDDYPGDRMAALDWAAAEVERACAGPAGAGTAVYPLIADAAGAALAVGAGPVPLLDLIAANRLDQVRSSYATWDDLVGYCRLSADPIGHLVLAVWDVSTPPRRLLSNDVCTALQIAEHLQDVAEDALAGRIYLPAEDLRRFGVRPEELVELARAGAPAPATVRALIGFETWRAHRLLDRGAALVATLRGSARAAVAGFVAGGYGALEAVAASGYDPMAGAPRPSAPGVAGHFLRIVGRRGVGPDRLAELPLEPPVPLGRQP